MLPTSKTGIGRSAVVSRRRSHCSRHPRAEDRRGHIVGGELPSDENRLGISHASASQEAASGYL
jgi:hypothetical protein